MGKRVHKEEKKSENVGLKWDRKDRARLRRERRVRIRQIFRLLSHPAILLEGRLCPQYDGNWTQQGRMRTLMQRENIKTMNYHKP